MITFPSRKQPFSGGVREGTWCRNACWYPQGPHSSSSSNLALFSILSAESFKEESRVCPQTWGRECANGADMQWRGNKEPAAQGCSQKHSGVLGKPFIAQKGFLNCKTSGWTRLLSVPTATPSLSVVLQTVTALVTVCDDRLWCQPWIQRAQFIEEHHQAVYSGNSWTNVWGRERPLSAHVQCVEAAGWKMPSWWVISPAFVGPPKLPVRKSALVLATHSPGAGSPPVPRSGQKAISFLWIRPILYALIPEFNVSLRFGPQHFGIAST